MGFTFTEIERKKGLRILLLFGVLLLIWLSITFVIGLIIFFRFDLHLAFDKFFAIAVFSLFFAVIHFLISSSRAVQKTVSILNAAPPDMDDELHRQFKNVIDEMNIATGTVKNIEGLVAPSLSLNALAVSNLWGGSAIILTEGLLSRLTREELEAVIAHEAYHIVSGDCMEASASISLFSLYADLGVNLDKSDDPDDVRIIINPIFWLIRFMNFLGNTVGMFISREREYRADAASARITRNPMALASALYKIGRGWSGAGFIGNGIEMLCIGSPEGTDTANVKTGFIDKLLSTHPPIDRRIEILLRMAHKNLSHLQSATDKTKQVDIENPDIAGMLLTRIDLSDRTLTDINCPKCKRPLYEVDYESTRIYECAFCRGALVKSDRLPRIIARRDKQFSARVKNIAIAVQSDNFKVLAVKRRQKKAARHMAIHMNCPKCSRPMMRTFYSLAYLIEIDRCGMCRIDWFDPDELEMLQYLIETKAASNII